VFGLFVQRGETDPSMVGLARASGDGDTFYLDDVYVAQSHQGCGLGVAFLQLVLEGQDRNAYRWLLHTGDRKDWYIDKLGFTFVGKASAMTADKTPLYILEKDGLHLKSTGDRRG
jgi:GNAT superfamily N-acetyltransferase